MASRGLRRLATGLATIALMAAPATADNPDHVRQLRETRRCANCDLSNAQLGGVQVEMGVLRNANLRGAVLYKAVLRGTDFAGAVLTGANLSGADLTGARGINFSGATTDVETRCPDGSLGPC